MIEAKANIIPAGAQENSEQSRIISLDFMRGVAVLGILLANIVGFSQPMLGYFWAGALTSAMDRADELVWLVQYLLIDGKMRALFTLLFGAGLILFVDSRGPVLQIRRLIWLAMFGLAHYFLLFRGDILFSYAICGLIALPLASFDARRLIIMGLLGYVLGGCLSSLIYLPQMQIEQALLAACGEFSECAASPAQQDYSTEVAGELAKAAAETQIMQGSFAGIVSNVWSEHLWGPVEGAALALFETLPLIFLGMGLYRAGLFDGRMAQRIGAGRFTGLGLAGVVLGILLTLPLALWVSDVGHPLYLSTFVFLGPTQLSRLPMILGLAVLLALAAPRAASGWLGVRLVAAGRMAFSNYLGTSLVMAFVFQGWGLGWFGQLDRTGLLGVVIAGWLAMLAWSAPWLARFRYGPLEYIWRCLTYGQIFAMRR